MRWVDSIGELDYYVHPQNATVPCYCEQLAFPSDLVLQASFNNLYPNPSIVISVLSADGVTTYEDATSYFEYYFFILNGVQYCNIRLKSYSPAMCTYKCWILNVKITGSYTLFDKYTNRYCQTSCCDIPRNIVFEGDSQDLINQAPLQVPTTDCGKPLIRLEVTFDCFDNQLGDFYGIPIGQTWGFKKITNIQGKLRERPRPITRNISYNCNTQRSESFLPVEVKSQGIGTFPNWKKDEIEAMFHAPTIYITDFKKAYDFQFDGGEVVSDIGNPPLCWNLFQINTVVRKCIIRQTFGCNEPCIDTGGNLTFLIPENYGGGFFYTENRQQITDYENLLDWYRVQNGISEVTDVTGEYDNVYAAFNVVGNSYIPTQFYFDSVSPRNRVFGVPNPTSPVVVCDKPIIGIILIEEDICAIPVSGEAQIEDQIATEYSIYDYNNWDVNQETSSIRAVNNWFKIDITSVNSDVSMTSPIIFLNMEIIGMIQPEAIPVNPQTIILDDVSMLTIDTFGAIRYTGYPTSYTEESITVTLNNIYYYGT